LDPPGVLSLTGGPPPDPEEGTMRAMHRARGALGVAALCLVFTGCATPRAEEGPRDVRVVDLSDEAAEKIAERVAAYMPKPAPTAAQPRAVRGRVMQPQPVVEVRIEEPPAEIFVPVPDVAPDRLRSASSKAVDAALDWLARHQAEDGAWYAAGFHEQCDGAPCGGPGGEHYTPGLTGMALLAFLEDGHTHRSGEHQEVVLKGLRYLKRIQDAEGCFGPRVSQHFMYNHALCSLAVVTAYGLTKSDLFQESAQSAVNFVQHARNPYMGWRYGVRDGDNDTSMTSWMTMVLAQARQVGLTVDDNAFQGAVTWVDKMTDPEFGRVGYNHRGGPTARTQEAVDKFPSELSEAMTAAGLLIRIHAGQSPASSEPIQKGADLLAARPPMWNVERGSNDFYYWQLGTWAMSRVGGPRWDKWRSALHAAVVEHQNEGDGGAAGSWDPVDAWSNDGGRVYATATLCLALLQVEHSLR
jgi:hypothetical protein